ncbi:MAG: hypothetical protein WC969_08260 [Elusimicrobiota bacterium]|jgi:hypothetical protein
MKTRASLLASLALLSFLAAASAEEPPKFNEPIVVSEKLGLSIGNLDAGFDMGTSNAGRSESRSYALNGSLSGTSKMIFAMRLRPALTVSYGHDNQSISSQEQISDLFTLGVKSEILRIFNHPLDWFGVPYVSFGYQHTGRSIRGDRPGNLNFDSLTFGAGITVPISERVGYTLGFSTNLEGGDRRTSALTIGLKYKIRRIKD